MGKVCQVSGKKTVAGQGIQSNSSGSKWRYRAPRSKRVFKPNLRTIKAYDNLGNQISLTVAMKIYKKLRKDGVVSKKLENGKKVKYFLQNPVGKIDSVK